MNADPTGSPTPPPLPPTSPRRPPVLPPRPAPKKKSSGKKTALIIALCVGVPVLLVIGFGLLGYLFLLTASEVPVEPADRAMLLDAHAVNEWMTDYEVQDGIETVTKTRYIDGTHEVAYEYEDDREDDYLYVYSSVDVEHRLSDAITVYTSIDLGMKIGAGDVEFDERNDLLKWGDVSRCCILRENGQPFGNYFITRKGKRVMTIMISGVYFDDAESLRELLQPYLDRLDSYKP